MGVGCSRVKGAQVSENARLQYCVGVRRRRCIEFVVVGHLCVGDRSVDLYGIELRLLLCMDLVEMQPCVTRDLPFGVRE